MIQREIGDRLALLLLEGKFAEGDTVTVDADATASSRSRDGAGHFGRGRRLQVWLST